MAVVVYSIAVRNNNNNNKTFFEEKYVKSDVTKRRERVKETERLPTL